MQGQWNRYCIPIFRTAASDWPYTRSYFQNSVLQKYFWKPLFPMFLHVAHQDVFLHVRIIEVIRS